MGNFSILFLLDDFDHQYGGSKFLRNVANYLATDTASY